MYLSYTYHILSYTCTYSCHILVLYFTSIYPIIVLYCFYTYHIFVYTYLKLILNFAVALLTMLTEYFY